MPRTLAMMQASSPQTRRSLLRRSARLVMGLAGIAALGVPSARLPVQTALANHTCGSPQWCGLCGVPCDGCGYPGNSCPSGTYAGSYWSRCCPIEGNYFVVRYWDCCSWQTSYVCEQTGCGNWCGPWIDIWCPAGDYHYFCTKYEIISTC